MVERAVKKGMQEKRKKEKKKENQQIEMKEKTKVIYVGHLDFKYGTCFT